MEFQPASAGFSSFAFRQLKPREGSIMASHVYHEIYLHITLAHQE
jgi:hypothetical protein